jgi:competence protein ComEC
VISHDQSDHAGGLAELMRSLPVDRLALGAASPRLSALADAAGIETVPLAEGGELRVGALRLTALWPPRELTGTAEDLNARSLVLVADWRHLSLLLTGDAEAEAVPLDPGPVDVLKVAHHGSADDGLAALLERTAPKLAVISVGENSYGHPAAPTLAALGEHGVPVARTDRDGEIAIEADARGWTVGPAP